MKDSFSTKVPMYITVTPSEVSEVKSVIGFFETYRGGQESV